MARLYGMRFKLCHVDGKIPQRGTRDAAGADLFSREDLVIPPREQCLVRTGVRTIIKKNYFGHVLGRSGLALHYGISVLGGVIDRDYRGEIGVILMNNSERAFEVNRGDRIAQIVCVATGNIKAVCTEPDSKRNSRGYGSTGIK